MAVTDPAAEQVDNDSMPNPLRIGALIYAGFQAMDIFGPYEVSLE